MPRLGPAFFSAAILVIAAGCNVGLPDSAAAYMHNDAGTGSAATPAEAPKTVASTSTSPPAPPDAGPKCAPGPTNGFALRAWKPLAALHRGACTPEIARHLTDCLFSSARPADCDQMLAVPAYAQCHACAITTSTAPVQGAVIDEGFGPYPNTPGCVAALSGDSSAGGCGAKLNANMDCTEYVCMACQATEADHASCIATAETGPCGTTYDPTCAHAYDQACYGASPIEGALQIINLFCGP